MSFWCGGVTGTTKHMLNDRKSDAGSRFWFFRRVLGVFLTIRVKFLVETPFFFNFFNFLGFFTFFHVFKFSCHDAITNQVIKIVFFQCVHRLL